MIVAVALIAAFASGVEPRRLILLAGAIYLPAVVGLLVAFHWLRSRSDYEIEPSLFCEGGFFRAPRRSHITRRLDDFGRVAREPSYVDP